MGRVGTIAALSRRFGVLLAAFVVLLAFASTAAAHHMTVSPPGQDEPMEERWVGGPPGLVLPDAAAGQGLHESPFGAMPAAHSAGPNDDKGLVQACESTRANRSAVTFKAPPFGSCQHGVMP